MGYFRQRKTICKGKGLLNENITFREPPIIGNPGSVAGNSWAPTCQDKISAALLNRNDKKEKQIGNTAVGIF